jgi:hypothetical protein
VAGWVSANLLDGITGKGSVEQIGTLPLTLGSPQGNPNTYTGGTTIRAGAVLIAGSPTALGRRDSAATVSSTSGRVFNRGTLQAAENQRPINVPGDYNQSELTTGPLPVELSAFAAAPEEPATVHLTWTTSSEKNSAHFEVERSTNGEAGFTAIGQLPAAGTSTTARAYRLTDARLPDAPQLYYRLRQVDTDGTVSYSPIRVVARPSAEPAQLQAYPNPAAQSVHVRLLGPAQPAPRELLDATGRLVRTLPAPAAGTEAVLPLTGLPAGLYVLRCGKLRQSLTLQ